MIGQKRDTWRLGTQNIGSVPERGTIEGLYGVVASHTKDWVKSHHRRL